MSTTESLDAPGTSPVPLPAARTRTAWAGIVALMATSFVLVVAEFLPPSLLPAMSASLRVTEGQAGQTVAATALAGLFAAPLVGVLIPRLDRRTLLVVLAAAAAVSSALVAISGDFALLLVARLILGAALGGFWAMSIALAARMSTPAHLGRAIMVVNAGTTLATVAGIPVGTYLGGLLDWRAIFVGVAVVTALVAVVLRVALPPLPPTVAGDLRLLLTTLRRPGIPLGLTGHVLTVLGHFTAFTYIRLAVERVPGIDAGGVALLLGVFGLGGVAGNLVVGSLVDRHLAVLRYVVPILIGSSIAVVAAFPDQVWLLATGVGLWGVGFGAWVPTLSTWMARTVPDRMEQGGGLIVAGFQLAILVGAGVGGLILDVSGIVPALVLGAVSAVVGGVVFGLARPARRGPVPR